MPSKKESKCSCNKNVTKTQKSVGCRFCGLFFHIECVNITEDQHKMFYQNKGVFSFVCIGCSSNQSYRIVEDSSSATNDIQQELHELTTEIGKQFEEHNRMFEQQVYASIATLENKMLELFDKFRAEQSDRVDNLRTDVMHNYNLLKQVDAAANKRVSDLETYNNILQRRLNRADIIIKGLPKQIRDLKVPILKIMSLCGLSLSHDGIQHCTYIHNGRAVLVKLNSVQNRDQIMMNFSKMQYLLLKDIIGGNVASKVFLRDHLTSAAIELISICRDLRSDNKILKYKFINTDIPKVRVTLPNNMQKTLNIQQCSIMMDEAQVLNDIDQGASHSGSVPGLLNDLTPRTSSGALPCRRSCSDENGDEELN